MDVVGYGFIMKIKALYYSGGIVSILLLQGSTSMFTPLSGFTPVLVLLLSAISEMGI